jgi:DNA-binding MarR family transcriptional regulator
MAIEQTDEPVSVPQAPGRLRVALDDAYTQASRELGLTPQQAELLCAAQSSAAVGDLAAALRCDRSNVTRLVDRAAKRGFVRRRDGEEDGRVTIVELTPNGRRLAERFIERLEARTRPLRAAWTDERRRTAGEILTEIADTLDFGARRPSQRPGRTNLGNRRA